MPVEHLSSIADARLDDYRIVREPELAAARGLFVAEGRIVVERLIATARFEIVSLLVTPAARHALTASLAALDPVVPILVVDTAALEAIAGFNLHRGCLALARRPRPTPIADLLHESVRTVVVIDGAADADNVGAIFRNARAFGVDAVVISPTTCDPWYRKAIRTSMAATLQMPFARAVRWPADLSPLRAKGFASVALTPSANAVPLADAVSRLAQIEKLAIIVGAEGSGLAPEVETWADVPVRIPMAAGVDSLNVAVATGVALYAFGRLRPPP